jgi:hypothetical protein
MRELSAPKNVTFIVLVVLALVAVVVHFANVDLPISPSQGFMILLLGYLVLAAGNVVRGL